MRYTRISADCHINVPWLPPDLFTANASPSMKARMPYVVDGPDGPHWTTRAGAGLGLVGGTGSSGQKYVPGANKRLDVMEATGFFSDGRRGIRRPTTPELRIEDMDRDGVQAEVIFGILGAATRLADHEASAEMFRIYNDWVIDLTRAYRDRMLPLACLPHGDVGAAVGEIRRVATLGFRGLELSCSWNMEPMWHPVWEPLWQAVHDVNLPLHFHTFPSLPQTVRDRQTGLTRRAAFFGWLPYALDRMDFEWEDRFTDLGLTMKPSEYWRRQCKATFQFDRIGTKLLDDLGVETLMWGSDYPHPDGVWPESDRYIAEQFGHLPAEVRRKITCDNAGTFYGLMS